MGLIRKSFMVGTVGLVSGSSKKQRVAKASLKELQAQTRLLEKIADPGQAERERAARQEMLERRQQRLADLKARNQVLWQKRKSQMRVNSFGTLVVRFLGWLITAFFAIGAIGAAESTSVVGAVVCFLIAAGIAALLLKAQKNQPAK